MSLSLSGNGVVTGLDSAASSDLGAALGAKLDATTAASTYLPIAGGKILQIVRATDGTNRSTTSTSFVDASISVTITPQKSDSAILLIWQGVLDTTASSGSDFLSYVVITDNSNNEIEGTGIGVASQRIVTGFNLIAYVAPATTSPVTFKGRFRKEFFVTSLTIRNGSTYNGSLYAIEVSA